MISRTDPSELDVDTFRGALLAIYADLDAEVARRAPVCQLSGRCCRFKEYDHTLFLSAPELSVLLADAPAPFRPLDKGLTCPWQDAQGRCTAREARPLGCRVYFCDPNYEGQAADLSEIFLARLKRLAEDFELPWNYAPLHQHLRSAWSQRTQPDPDTDESS
jgi:Fe-S-cluster containining protein